MRGISRLMMLIPRQLGSIRLMSQASESSGEGRIKQLLQTRFPEATGVEVQDISGGCGSMYEVWVEATDFKGLSRVKQHRLITEALKEEIADMHGVRISTSVPQDL